MTKPVIITSAVTGGVHMQAMPPYPPITPDETAAASIEAAEADASIIHLHARDPETGKPDPSAERFKEFLPRIKQSTNAVVDALDALDALDACTAIRRVMIAEG